MKIATQNSKDHKKVKETPSPKVHNNLLVTRPKDMEIYDLPYKELRIAVVGKLSELQENMER